MTAVERKKRKNQKKKKKKKERDSNTHRIDPIGKSRLPGNASNFETGVYIWLAVMEMEGVGGGGG